MYCVWLNSAAAVAVLVVHVCVYRDYYVGMAHENTVITPIFGGKISKYLFFPFSYRVVCCQSSVIMHPGWSFRSITCPMIQFADSATDVISAYVCNFECHCVILGTYVGWKGAACNYCRIHWIMDMLKKMCF